MSLTSSERKFDDDRLVISSGGRNSYGAEYKHTVFLTWYRLGKPAAHKLSEVIEADANTGCKPSLPVLRNWMMDFREQATFLDSQVAKQLEEQMIAEKVEMLDRHAKLGVELQDKASKYLNEHEDELKVPMAIKMLIEGVRIERESRGIASALEKMLEKSDDDLLKEVIALVNKAPVEFEQIESSIEIDNEEIVE